MDEFLFLEDGECLGEGGKVLGFGPGPGRAAIDPRAGVGVLGDRSGPGGREAGPHGAVHAEMAGEGPGVDAFHDGDAVLAQPCGQRSVGAPVARTSAVFPHDEGVDPRTCALEVVGVDAVVVDEWIGEGGDLAPERWIGADLLVAGHGGAEDGFPSGPCGGLVVG